MRSLRIDEPYEPPMMSKRLGTITAPELGAVLIMDPGVLAALNAQGLADELVSKYIHLDEETHHVIAHHPDGSGLAAVVGMGVDLEIVGQYRVIYGEPCLVRIVIQSLQQETTPACSPGSSA